MRWRLHHHPKCIFSHFNGTKHAEVPLLIFLIFYPYVCCVSYLRQRKAANKHLYRHQCKTNTQRPTWFKLRVCVYLAIFWLVWSPCQCTLWVTADTLSLCAGTSQLAGCFYCTSKHSNTAKHCTALPGYNMYDIQQPLDYSQSYKMPVNCMCWGRIRLWKSPFPDLWW